MNFVLRYAIGLAIAILIFMVIVRQTGMTPEMYMPPAKSFDQVTQKAVGTVTKVEERGYTDHIFSGMQNDYYVDYTFHAIQKITRPDGQVQVFQPAAYIGSVMITEADYNKIKVGDPVTVRFDRADPTINGVIDTLGVYSATDGWLNCYLWYWIAVVVATVGLAELLKKWMPTGD
jgi:hypothetical protein